MLVLCVQVLIIPFVETIQVVDIRVITINIVSQEVMTEDNVPCSIDGCF
jgi:uncharacterized membrane protein YqiK